MRRLAVLMAVAFVDMIGLMLVLPLLPLYALKLNATATLIGFLTASFPVAQLLASPVWGRVSDRYGRRPALLVGLTASAIAYVVFGFAGSLGLLFVSRFVQGLGGGTTGVAQAYVADTMPPHERAKALGWLSAATSLGVVIGPVVGSFAARGGQAAPGLVAAALCLCNVAFAWRWLPESRVLPTHSTTPSGRHLPPPEPRPVLNAVWEVVRHPGRPAARVIWIYAVAMLAYNSAPAVFTLYLSWRFGIDVTNIGWFFTVFGGVGVLMRAFVVGPVNDRLGEVRTMRLGAGLYALGYALLPLATSIPAFLGFQVFLPLGTALLFPATSALVSHRTDQHEFGLMMGVQQAMRGVASVAGPIWAGFAYQDLGPSVPFFACAVIIGCALLLATRVPREEPVAAAA
ncbi:MAG TPA: MFS transporter [Gemmatimonadales bacterium]|jgi:multidrug resistance protein|nr:MFS transporter [Gemmatimonadales bacterium]